ncbi:Deoxyhypusine hydroxylase [Dictyocoela muelleri]|nr:Deoxyhypusine hydroxylase [Dictyocoela muelleri]
MEIHADNDLQDFKKYRYDDAEQILLRDSPIINKMRTLFYLRNIQTKESAEILCKVFNQKSVLLMHEVAYVLGQMQFDETKNILISVLEDENQDVVVRHEAGEALGNFKDKSLIPILEKYVKSPLIPLRETCYVAIKKLMDDGDEPSPFNSFDPAYPMNDFDKAVEIFLNPENDLYDRYKAMFTLRNENTPKAVEILSKGFQDKSSLLKHEVAFVMGQMRLTDAIDALEIVISKEDEHPMVRHEAAEALGAIGTDMCVEILNRYVNHSCDILRESCEVALNLIECERNNSDYCEIN